MIATIWESFNNLPPFWYWGIALILIFPIIIIVLNEFTLTAQKENSKLETSLRTFKNIIVPLAAVIILLVQVMDFERSSITIKILETILWVLIINYGLGLLTKLTVTPGKNPIFEKGVPQLFLDIFRVVMVTLGGAILLSEVWGQELGSMVTALGLGSFVLGLALQDTLGNLFSGIALIYEKPFNVGDYIKVDEQTGQVIEMNWRAVHLLTRQKELLVMPHRMIAQASIMNYSKPSRVHIMQQEMGFSYNDAPNIVKEALMETCLTTPGILSDPLPEIKTIDYADSAIVYEIEFGIADFKDHEEILDELMTRLYYMAKRKHFSIPFPQHTIHYAEKTPSTKEEIETILKKSIENLPKFLPIEEKRAKELEDGSEILYFGKNEIIYHQGDLAGPIYVVLKGQINLYAKEDFSGKEILINTLQEGEFFGEVALLSKRKNIMTAKAQTDVEIIKILQDEVMDMVSENPNLAFKLGEVIEMRKKTRSLKLDKNYTSANH